MPGQTNDQPNDQLNMTPPSAPHANDGVGPTSTVELTPNRFVAGGETIARDDGKVVFVRGAVPGDTVDVALSEIKKDWSRGHVDHVVDPGPDRVEPPCAARVRGCGGCDWQHVAVDAQLGYKADIVADAMRRTAKLADASIGLGASVPSSGYRTTVRVVGDARGRPSFRAERSADPIAFGTCPVAHPSINEALIGVCIDPELELTLRVSAATGEATARWDEHKGTVTGLAPHIRTGADAALAEVVDGYRLVVSAASFFQSGPAAAGLLVDAVQRAAPELSTAEVVVDAYAGVGLFAVAATAPNTHLITIESSRSAHADSIVNLAGRSVESVRGEVGHWKPTTRFAEPGRVDVVIADPARTGLGKPGVAALARPAAPVMVLVSCDPVALARDTILLANRGYRHVHSEVLDLFPMTHHVEAVTRFEFDD